MAPDALVHEGLLRTCNSSTNLILIGVVEKRNENGGVVATEQDIVMLRGDQVCFIALNERHAAHFTTTDIRPLCID
jgi:hypothetical protein